MLFQGACLSHGLARPFSLSFKQKLHKAVTLSRAGQVLPYPRASHHHHKALLLTRHPLRGATEKKGLRQVAGVGAPAVSYGPGEFLPLSASTLPWEAALPLALLSRQDQIPLPLSSR